MSRYNQQNQNVETQYNIAGDLNLNKSYGILWIKALGDQRYFLKEAKSQVGGGLIGQLLELAAILTDNTPITKEPDFNVYVGKNLVKQMNVGDLIKINVEPGECKVHVQLNVTPERRQVDTGLAEKLDNIHYREGKNNLVFPINPGEIVELEYEKMNLMFKQ